MRQLSNLEKKLGNQNSKSISASLAGAHETTIHLKPGTDKSNTILVQNIGKDPPGRCRSPEEACRLDPENRPVSFKSSKTLFHIDFQIFKQIQNPNFLTINFYKMKKQIFILVFLVVATFASVSNSYGQAIAGSAPRPLTIDVTNPLKPIAGKPYTYSAVIDPVGGQAYWYATKATTFMTAGARVAGIELPESATAILAGSTNYMTLAAAATSPTSTIVTWTSDVLNGVSDAAPLFMVVEYNGPLCTTSNNIKVMKLEPINAFTVDIKNMLHGATPTTLAYDAAESQCYAGVFSSMYDIATKTMINDYGVNDLYFEVVAANFTGAFKPTFKLSGLKATQTADIDWGVTVGTYGTSAGTNIALAAMPYTSPEQTVTTSVANTTGGVSIYVRVRVKNNGYEGLTAAGDPVTLAVDATDNSATPNPDVIADGTVNTAFADLALQTVNARPTVTPGTTMILQKP